jgi:hypothetical protein
MGQPESRSRPRNIRRDGWTAERQLGFLAALSQTSNVTRAAHAVGMSRESAYRLRARDPHGLFAAAWDGALGGPVWTGSPAEVEQSHIHAIRSGCGTEGRYLRLNGVTRSTS